jgi:hypothetical protein
LTGALRFNRETGLPVLKVRTHDVEEFVGVVRRYGTGHSANLQALVHAASQQPEVAEASLRMTCGTCMGQAA